MNTHVKKMKLTRGTVVFLRLGDEIDAYQDGRVDPDDFNPAM